MRYLIFISLASLLISCSGKVAPSGSATLYTGGNASDDNKAHFYRTTIDFGTNHITGLMIVKISPDMSVRGSFTNEFGVKGFDFISKEGRTQLIYLMPMLDKIFIRKVLKRDISLLSDYGFKEIRDKTLKEIKTIDITGKKAGITTSDEKIVLEDIRYKVKIELIAINKDEQQKEAIQ